MRDSWFVICFRVLHACFSSWFVICFRVLHACFSLFHFLFNSASEVQMPDMRDSVFVRLNRLLVNCFLFALCCFTYNLPNLLILPNRATKFGFGKIRFEYANSRIFSSVRKFGCNIIIHPCKYEEISLNNKGVIDTRIKVFRKMWLPWQCLVLPKLSHLYAQLHINIIHPCKYEEMSINNKWGVIRTIIFKCF